MRVALLVMFCLMSLDSGLAETGWVEAYAANLQDLRTAGNEWWSTAGEIAVANGKLALTPGKWGAGDAYLFTPRFPGSVRLEITASVSSTAVRSDAAFEVHLNANVPVGTHPQAGYSFRFAIDGTTPPLLLRGGLVLARANASGVRLRSGTTYRIAAQQYDGELSLSVDGVPVISIKDTPLESGALDIVGLAVRGCSVNIESLAVYTLRDSPWSFSPMPRPDMWLNCWLGCARCGEVCSILATRASPRTFVRGIHPNNSYPFMIVRSETASVMRGLGPRQCSAWFEAFWESGPSGEAIGTAASPPTWELEIDSHGARATLPPQVVADLSG